MDVEPIYASIGQRIQERRKELKLTQDALAQVVGLTRTSITNIEKGRQRLLVHTLLEIADKLRIDIAALLPPLQSDPHELDSVEEVLARAGLSDTELDFVRKGMKK